MRCIYFLTELAGFYASTILSLSLNTRHKRATISFPLLNTGSVDIHDGIGNGDDILFKYKSRAFGVRICHRSLKIVFGIGKEAIDKEYAAVSVFFVR